MKLTFLGGADEVGASCTLVEIGGKMILVDAGIRISPKTSRGIQNDQLPHLAPISDAGGPDYILVTHAHTDHTGALPLVVEQYPHVPVIVTRPTEALVRVLQNDAQRIMKSRQDQEGELPLFDEIAVERLMDAFQIIEFNQPLRLGDGVQVTYYASGHIAGAGMLVFESEDGTLVMSGDVSMNEQRAVVTPKIPRIKADALVLESTYGGRQHANRKAEEMRLIETLKNVTERGGKVLIPAFALGRAQEIIQIILAYRDQFDAPVYIDGMVRSVCNAYSSFPDLLPESSVKRARHEPLFFRNDVKPIKNRAHREEVARSDTPLVVVASSGMLTGGASVMYAKHFASEPRNAIFLTGYQDEEAPGRFLQRIMREREQGEEPTLRLDDSTVTVRCEIGTYSLSAHADESELVSVAEAMDATDIMLVHGDPSARHSLATRLRQRGRRVILPKIGQTEDLTYQKRPWAIGRVDSGHQTVALNPQTLWEQLKSNAGNFYSAQELAQMWWGEASRAKEAQQALERDTLYFAPDWRSKSTFQVHSEKQVERIHRRQAIMLANPDIVGKLIVMRNSNNQPRLAVVRSASIDGFEADVAGTKGRNHPADALLWVINDWAGYGDPEERKGVRSQLRQLMQNAQALQDIILPFSKRQQLVDAGQPVIPNDLLPTPLPDDVTEQEALVGVVLALARDGAQLEQAGLIPQRATQGGPVEQNTAREIALNAFPPEARLRKVGMDVNRKRLTLTFDFPDMASREFGDIIEQIIEQTNWDVHIKQGVNQQALSMAIDELLPDGATVIKGPSFYMDRHEIAVDVQGVEDEQSLKQAYMELTSFRLLLNSKGGTSDDVPTSVAPNNIQERMEINAAYSTIRDALEDEGLYKTSLKQGQIVLTFISPQVGERHTDSIRSLAEETGYPLSIHPHPNQQMILQVVNKLLRDASLTVRKGPGIHVDRGAISVTLAENSDEDALDSVKMLLELETGYQLDVSVG